MTADEAREMFGSSSGGYVRCDDCPLKVDDCGCKTGYEDCWEAIAAHMTKIELAETKKTEAVDHPAHYQGKHECINEMIALFGVEAVKHFCMCNVYKYRFRAANKNGQEDLDKADWYMDKLMELEKGNV